MPQRAEEISCSNWKARGATQLDVSFFNMLQGGGLMTHFKMFLPQNLDLADKRWREERGFDNFLKFIPIEQELRGAVRLDDDLAGWTSSKGVDYGAWCYETLLGGGLLVGTSVTPSWRKAKAVFVSEREKELRAEEVVALANYVKKGGHLFMPWQIGGVVVGRPDVTNALLRAFGISSPTNVWHRDWYFNGVVTQESPWWARTGGGANAFETRFRSPAAAPADAGEVLMRMRDPAFGGSPALTRKAYGKGCVYVLWGDHMVPFTHAPAELCGSKPFLAEIAADSLDAARRLCQSPEEGERLLSPDDEPECDGRTCRDRARSAARLRCGRRLGLRGEAVAAAPPAVEAEPGSGLAHHGRLRRLSRCLIL